MVKMSTVNLSLELTWRVHKVFKAESRNPNRCSCAIKVWLMQLPFSLLHHRVSTLCLQNFDRMEARNPDVFRIYVINFVPL